MTDPIATPIGPTPSGQTTRDQDSDNTVRYVENINVTELQGEKTYGHSEYWKEPAMRDRIIKSFRNWHESEANRRSTPQAN